MASRVLADCSSAILPRERTTVHLGFVDLSDRYITGILLCDHATYKQHRDVLTLWPGPCDRSFRRAGRHIITYVLANF